MRGEQCPLVGVVGEDLHRGGQLVARVVSVPAASRVAASMSSSSWERKVRAHRCQRSGSCASLGP